MPETSTTNPLIIFPDGQVPDLPTHAPDGTDLTLIRWMLALTVEDRLHAMQSQAQFILKMRRDNGLA